MNKIQSILMIVILITTVGCCCKVEEKKNEDGLQQKVEKIQTITEADAKKIVQVFNDAIVNPSVELLNDLCVDGLTYGHSSGLIQNKAEFIDDLVNGPYDFKSVTSPELSIEVSEETVVARFIFLANAIKEGKSIDIRLGCVQIYQRGTNGKLKLLARQAYKLP